ncbi:MAG: InlB B-repeat-containing protein [Lachnospiraceae bacterium]|nr:InlB B-repeat-containing protein [Lachnospiraceae bacterium]
MSSNVQTKRKKRFWALFLAVVMMVGMMAPVEAAEYAVSDKLKENETTKYDYSSSDIYEKKLLLPGDKINFTYSGDYSKAEDPQPSHTYNIRYFDSDKTTYNDETKMNGKGGTISSPSSSYTYTIESLPSDTSTSTYYGWKVVSFTGSGEKEQGFTYNIDLRAVLEDECTITYNMEEGDVNPESNKTTYSFGGEGFTLSDASRVGYSFEGWFTDWSYTNPITEINDQVIVSNRELNCSNNYEIVIYPNFTAKSYKFQFANGQDIINANPATTYTFGDTVITFPTNPTKPGYTFKGWAYNPDDTTAAYDPDVTSKTVEELVKGKGTDDSDTVSLYAIWEPYTYKVRFNANEGSGSMTDQDFSYGTAQALKKNTFTRTGYTFNGWNTVQTPTTVPGTSYADEQSVSNLTTVNNDTVDLYAQWTPNGNTKYVIKHWQQKLTATSDTENETNYEEVTADKEEKTGTTGATISTQANTYEGFTSPSDQDVNIAADGSAVVNYYYKRNSYTVAVNAGTGIATVSGAGTYKYGANVALSYTLTDGYSFKNWTGDKTSATFTMPASDVTVTANGEPTSYSITYNLVGGSVDQATPNPTSYTIESAAITLNNPTRTGYTFTGWTSTSLPAKTTSVTIPANSTGDRTYTANWSADEYTITLDPNGGAITPDIFEKDNGADTYSKKYTIESSKIDLPVPAKTGFSFGGWQDTSVTTVQIVENVPNGSTGDKNYRAVWTEKNDTAYKVRHWKQKLGKPATPENETNYEEVLSDVQNLTGTTNSKVTPVVKTYEGFTSPVATEITIDADGSSELNYYYTRNSYVLSVAQGNGIESVTGANTYEYGASVTVGYTLKSGYENASLSDVAGTSYSNTFNMPAKAVSLTATASPINYTITLTGMTGAETTPANPTTYNIETPTFTLTNPTKVGYTFAGWSQGVAAGPLMTVTIPKGSTGNLTYEATWTPNTDTPYIVRHWIKRIGKDADKKDPDNYEEVVTDRGNLNGTTATNVSPDVNTYEGFKSPAKITKTIAPDGTMIIDYYYARNIYKVSVEKGLGIASVSGDGVREYGETVTLTCTYEPGYGNAVWSGDKDTNTFTMGEADVSMAVKSSLLDYKITYDLAGGALKSGVTNPEKYTIETADIVLANPEREGYEFDGWTSGATTAKTVTIKKGSTGDKKFTAKWSKKPEEKVVDTQASDKDKELDQTEDQEVSEKKEEIKGSVFYLLKAQSYGYTKNSISLSWSKIKGADGYLIYGSMCNSKGVKRKYQLLDNIKNPNKLTWTAKNLKENTYYKYYIKAYKNVNGKKKKLTVSKTIHATTISSKYGVAQSIALNKTKVSIKKNKTFKIIAKETNKDRRIATHRPICYESENTKIATVSAKGVVKAKKKGKVKIWVFAQNGISKSITINVK